MSQSMLPQRFCVSLHERIYVSTGSFRPAARFVVAQLGCHVETIIAANDHAVASRVRDALARVGIDCSMAGVLSHESAQAALRTNRPRTATIVLFCSQAFSAEDLAAVKQLSAAGGERARLIAIGPVKDPNVIIRVIRSGAVDVLDMDNRLEDELPGVIERLRAASAEVAPPGKLLTVVGTVGGVGASVLACNIAATIAQKGRSCELLDLHLRGGDQAKLLQVTPRHNLSSLATKTQQLDAAMFEQSLIQHDCGVRLLPSPEPFTDYRQCTPQLIQKVVQFARASCAYVVVDLEDVEHAEQVRTLASSDHIIVPVRPDLTSLYRTQKCLDYLARAHVDRDRITVVANRIGQPRELPVTRMAEVLETSIVVQIPDDPAAVNTSVNLGVPLVLSAPHARSARCLVHLTEILIGEAEPPGTNGNGWLAKVRSSVPLVNVLSGWSPSHTAQQGSNR